MEYLQSSNVDAPSGKNASLREGGRSPDRDNVDFLAADPQKLRFGGCICMSFGRKNGGRDRD